MAKILVVGSRKSCQTALFQNACMKIGEALATRGHTIVASSCGPDDAENWVLDGVESAAKNGVNAKLIYFSPDEPNLQNLIDRTTASQRWPHVSLEPSYRTRGQWAAGQAVALIRSDAALLIGGGPLTSNLGALAMEINKPYYAVQDLGGAARDLAVADYGKHKEMGMTQDLLHLDPALPQYGASVVRATEFVIAHQRDRIALRNSWLILLSTLTALALFLCFLFRHKILGNEARLVYTTSVGAIIGVLLVFLVGRAVDKVRVNPPEVLDQISLAVTLGVLYGFSTLEGAGLYRADISSWAPDAVDSLAMKMAMTGIAVGALLEPSSKGIFKHLRRAAKLD